MKISKNKLVKYSITSALALTLATGYLNSPNAKANELDIQHNTENAPETKVDQNSTESATETKVDQHNTENAPETKVDQHSTESATETKVDQHSTESATETKVDQHNTTNAPETKVDQHNTTNAPETKVDPSIGSVAQMKMPSFKDDDKEKIVNKNLNDRDYSKILDNEYKNTPHLYDRNDVYLYINGKKIDINNKDTHTFGPYGNSIIDYGIKINAKDFGENTYFYVKNGLRVKNDENGTINTYDFKWTIENQNTENEHDLNNAYSFFGLRPAFEDSSDAPFFQISRGIQPKGDGFINTNLKFYKHIENFNPEPENITENNQLDNPKINLQFYGIYGKQKFKIDSNEIHSIILGTDKNGASGINTDFTNDEVTLSGSEAIDGKGTIRNYEQSFIAELESAGDNSINLDISIYQGKNNGHGASITPVLIQDRIVKSYYKSNSNDILHDDTVRFGDRNSKYDESYNEKHGFNDQNLASYTDKEGNIWKLSSYVGLNNIHFENLDKDTNEEIEKKLQNAEKSYSYNKECNKIKYYYVCTTNNKKEIINADRRIQYIDSENGNIIKEKIQSVPYVKESIVDNNSGEVIYYMKDKQQIPISEEENAWFIDIDSNNEKIWPKVEFPKDLNQMGYETSNVVGEEKPSNFSDNKTITIELKHSKRSEKKSKEIKRTIRYLDQQTGNDLIQPMVQSMEVNYNEIFDNVNNKSLGLDIDQNGSVDIQNYDTNAAWKINKQWQSVQSPIIQGYYRAADVTSEDASSNDNIQLNVCYNKIQDESKKDTASSEKTSSGNNEQPSVPAEDDAKINDSQNNQSQGTIAINKKDNNNSKNNTNNNAAQSNHRKERNQDDGQLSFNNKKSSSNKITINGHKGNKSNSNNLIKRNNKNANKKAKINKSAKSNSVSSKDTPITINHQNQPASVVNNVNNDDVKKLPQTGEKSGIAYTLSGLAMLMVSIFTFVFRRNKNK
ncbi:LPXTG cell wall anchor domain-containing protein [Apilactobacillus xinyiensis]|uniref:LPXTG cell wall anchor domain-containing protein n=1 Tax=Apilactobacillus xinyiensis TaxID=2841032 RepID=UPI00200BF439|nr:LPXTG cell wall anchor domain-containing protein [Apilactobacillus xinyiensis]MCL0330354.1 LPXTG cell wall anchor domain-containing protein [Apilactobacillus xinyiensis]